MARLRVLFRGHEPEPFLGPLVEQARSFVIPRPVDCDLHLFSIASPAHVVVVRAGHKKPDATHDQYNRESGESMSGDVALQLLARMLWVGVLIAAPLLLITMAVGLLVSIFQVVTQIQDMSLSFIPKLLTVVVVLVAFGPWMLKQLVGYSAAVISSIPSYF